MFRIGGAEDVLALELFIFLAERVFLGDFEHAHDLARVLVHERDRLLDGDAVRKFAAWRKG